MVSRLNSQGIQTDRLILITPPPVYNHPDRTPKDYLSPVMEAATEVGATFIDIYHSFAKDNRQGKLFSDGLHFNLDGAKLFYSLIKDVVEEKVKSHKM
jgi:lysophospholipase L1-like esterase